MKRLAFFFAVQLLPAVALAAGNGSLTLSTASVLINTMTVNSASSALPTNLNTMTAVNLGTTDAAICPNYNTPGSTCTCPENGVAATNGITLPANFGGYVLTLYNVGSSSPSIVACSGTPTVQFTWP